jgi:HSP20 family protein
MFLTRWQPLLEREYGRLHNEMNRIFDQFGWQGGSNMPALSFSYPAMNIWEDENNVYAEAELPGMQQDQLQIFVSDGNQLTIQGERKPAELKGMWHRQERGFGKFSRVVTLPVPVDAGKVEAKLEQGVLHVTLPKSEEAKPRRITVKAE